MLLKSVRSTLKSLHNWRTILSWIQPSMSPMLPTQLEGTLPSDFGMVNILIGGILMLKTELTLWWRLSFWWKNGVSGTETIFIPIIEANNFRRKPNDQDDAGCKNSPNALQMVRLDDEALLQELRRMLLKMGISKQKLKCSPSSLMSKIKKD